MNINHQFHKEKISYIQPLDLPPSTQIMKCFHISQMNPLCAMLLK